MLPKIENRSQIIQKYENMATSLIAEDHLKHILAKQKNSSYKPYKNQNSPHYPQSPLGDFPEYDIKITKFVPKRILEPLIAKSGLVERKKPHKPDYNNEIQIFSNSAGVRGSSLPSKNSENSREKLLDFSGEKKRQLKAIDPRPIPPSDFVHLYDRGDLPCKLDHQGSGNKLKWKVAPDSIDFHQFLPMFFDGVREKMDPYRFLAITGSFELLDIGGKKILPVVPQLILPLKKNLNTRDLEIMSITLKLIQKLIICDNMIGETLVPYYRQLLPIMNIFKGKNANIGDRIDYKQRKRTNIGDLIQETLEMLETYGGEDAYINIKYMIPTYESCMTN